MDRFYLLPHAFQMGTDVADSQYSEKEIPHYSGLCPEFRYRRPFLLDSHGIEPADHLVMIGGNNQGVINNPVGTWPDRSWGCDATTGTLCRHTATASTEIRGLVSI